MNSEAAPSQDFLARLHVEESLGRSRENEPVRVGVPFPRGLVFRAEEVSVFDQRAQALPHQCRVLAFWPDQSVKWMLIDALVCVEASERAALSVRRKTSAEDTVRGGTTPELNIAEEAGRLAIDTGAARFHVGSDRFGPLQAVLLGSNELLAPVGSETRLRMADGKEYVPFVDSVRLEEGGSVRASILVEGGFARRGRRNPLLFKSRLVFFAGSSRVMLEFQIRNPRAACHPGGIWDLGDGGSCSFTDLSIRFHPREPVEALEWYAEVSGPVQRVDHMRFSLYQDSSGGVNWDSPNHVDFANKLTVSHPGYRVKAGEPGACKLMGEGRRATPCLRVSTEAGWIAATTRDFWQNFPKALRLEDGALSIGLFPAECSAGFELQGGEQKRHTVFFDFGPRDRESVIPLMQEPLAVSLDPLWVEECGVISWFAAAERDGEQSYSKYVDSIIEGPNSFFRKREVVDEYGWRNFGDLYADHEAVHHRGPKPMVSHYNNQYDFIYGAAVQFLRTGDARWQRLMEDAARHTIDIDIYHTAEDRAAYNGGLFWHTDHYKDAATSSHRSYSRRNGGRGYGGGPSNENNYTSGLLHYHYLSGDPEAADAVLELANWVIAMDDGALNLFGLIDSGPTGLASKTVSSDYHGPGRGGGNSVNALLDAYKLCNDRKFVAKAEELIQRCVHPADDLQALRLDEPEYRWSYLVFLQALGKYLELKRELEEDDYCYHYARMSLLRYAGWMLENEVPYKDVLHKVDIPTETWPAQDIRKCHVLYLASKYADPAMRVTLKRRAEFFFERCIRDLLGFDTAYLTRPLVILCVYGYVHSFFQKQADSSVRDDRHGYGFGEPRVFLPQRNRLKIELRRKWHLASAEIGRMLRAEWLRVRDWIGPSR
jgi:YetA-like protein